MKQSVDLFTDILGNQLEYCLYGHEGRYLFYFPGFGESYDSFQELAEKLKGYTIVSINLYFFGKSERKSDSKYLETKEWQNTFRQFLDHLRVDRFSVLGFSLGGRFAMSTFQAFHESMDHLILVASDGIIRRFIYRLVTFPVVMRPLFYFMMKHPYLLLISIDLMKTLKMMDSFTAKFVKTQLDSKEQRMRVYFSWVTFKKLRLSRTYFVKLLNKTSCDCTLIFGERDAIIDPKRHFHFFNRLAKCRVLVLPFGHYKLVDNSAQEICSILKMEKVKKMKGDSSESPNKNYPI